MDFTYQELAVLNQMIGIALLSGKIEFDEISESIHKKVTEEIVRRNRVIRKAEYKEEKEG